MTIYLIGNEANNLVKIGMTRDMRVRLSTIQQMSPVKLTVLWESDPAWYAEIERELHGALAAARKHGEWFDLGSAEQAVITVANLFAELTAGRPKPVWRPTSPLAHHPLATAMRNMAADLGQQVNEEAVSLFCAVAGQDEPNNSTGRK